MATDTTRVGRLKYYIRSTGMKCNSSLQAIQWIDCFNDVSARISFDDNGQEFTTAPLVRIDVNKAKITIKTIKGDTYELTKLQSKIRRITDPKFIIYSKKSEDIEDSRTEKVEEANKKVLDGRNVRAVYPDGFSCKAYSGFIKSFDLEKKSFETKTGITYYY